MVKAYKYRIYPTSKQVELINKHIGSVRFIYNLALECKKMAYSGTKVNISCFDLIKQLPDLKKECAWLKEVNSQSLQSPIINLDRAFIKFFNGQSGFPKFKSKSAKQSFNIPQNVIIKGRKLIIPKFQNGIDLVMHREVIGDIKQATISRTTTGKYFVSILFDDCKIHPAKMAVQEKTSIGVDLGIKHLLITSDGKTVSNPRFLKKSLSRLKFIQSKLLKEKREAYKIQITKIA